MKFHCLRVNLCLSRLCIDLIYTVDPHYTKIDHCCSFSACQCCEGGTGIIHKPRLNGICTGQPQHRMSVIFSIHSHHTVTE